jgi:hypothetical protein
MVKVLAVNLKGLFRLTALVGERMGGMPWRLDHQRVQCSCGATPGRTTC